MVVDISEYVNRYLNDYIVFHPENFISYGDYDKASTMFNEMYYKAINNLVPSSQEEQMNALLRNARNESSKAADALKILDGVQSGDILDKTLDLIAAKLNEGIEKAYKGFSFEDIIKQAKTFNSILVKANELKNTETRIKDINDFFNLILQGVEQSIKITPQFLDELTGIGKRLTGTKDFKIQGSGGKIKTVKSVSLADAEAANRIIETLKRAATKFEKNGGTLDSQSFSSTINHIFSTVIGEELSRAMLAKVVNDGIIEPADEIVISEVDNAMAKLGAKKKSKSAWVRGGRRQYKDRSGKTRVSKVDIFNTGSFILNLSVGGQTIEVEIASNTSVKWYSSLNERSEVHLVAGTPLHTYFDAGTPLYYAMANTITHRFSKNGGEYHDLYRELRAATAATFFNQWLSGSGSKITGSRQYLNKVQFLMINGKVYSVSTIVRNICNELMGLDAATPSKDMPFNMHIPNKIENKWKENAISPAPKPDRFLALVRSRLINETIKKLTISASLNYNVLLKYAHN